ncbi:MAG TPA: hypothetical protein VFZ31_12695 [Vicinamibacterales bacterium]
MACGVGSNDWATPVLTVAENAVIVALIAKAEAVAFQAKLNADMFINSHSFRRRADRRTRHKATPERPCAATMRAR